MLLYLFFHIVTLGLVLLFYERIHEFEPGLDQRLSWLLFGPCYSILFPLLIYDGLPF